MVPVIGATMSVEPALQLIDTGTARLSVRIQGTGPLVLFVHGFPEAWHSWRHQIDAVAGAGFRAAALQVRGYAGSQRFGRVEDYAMAPLVDDIVAVARALQPDRPAILVGHDWGAPMVWHTALTQPQAVAAVCGLSVPFTGVPEMSFDDVIRERFDDRGRFFYQSWFREPGVAEAVLEADPRGFLRKFFFAISGEAPDGWWPSRAPAGAALPDILPDPLERGIPLPGWMDQAMLDHYEADFRQSGFFGPLSRYRNHTRDFGFARPFAGRRIEQPALFIAGDRDPAFTGFGLSRTSPQALMAPHVPNLQGFHVLKGCGHWTQQERPDAVSGLLTGWLGGLTHN